MIISLNWIKRYLPSLDASVDQIDKALTAVGLEVEGVENLGEPYEKLIVAKVLECAKHPEADKLSITKVFNGTEEIQIVCGAPNVAAGKTVVLAPVGSKLPLPDGGELKLKKAKIRGVESFGMICAEDEIGLGSSHDGILVLDEALEAGKSIVDLGLT
jgi:phenylalanyl-tRNA synthetase beta chain